MIPLLGPRVSPMALDLAIAEHRASSYYAKWLRDNRQLGPAVDAYLAGGARPPDALIGLNHYGHALVLTEDARRG